MHRTQGLSHHSAVWGRRALVFQAAGFFPGPATQAPMSLFVFLPFSFLPITRFC